MFDIGSTIIYGTNGIYIIEDIRIEKFGVAASEQVYYVLKAASGNDVIYVPTDNEILTSQIKPLLTKSEIIELIKAMPAEENAEWIDDKKERADAFRDVFTRCDREELITLARTIYRYREERLASGKKLYTADENAMRRAEKIISEEFAAVFNIKEEEVLPFIISHMEIDTKSAAGE